MSVITVTSRELADMSGIERALLINSLPGYKTGMLVGTCDARDQTNLAVISSQVHLGSNPPLLAMILRPNTGQSERHTLGNILDTRCWSLNGFTLEHAARAHQTSAPYPKTQSEFDACGFEKEWRPAFAAPFVKDAPLQIGCILREHHPLAINGTHMVIGEVQRLHYPEAARRADGALALDAMGLVAISGLDTYTQPSEGLRFAPAATEAAPTAL
jgi:flavin reductase (DIM6/NTAB) family NADH-FMN oxidoreductase RutF